MRTIYKYEITSIEECELFLPHGAIFRGVGVQNDHSRALGQAGFDHVMVWFEIDTDRDVEKRTFRTFGTGHELPDEKLDYLGRFELAEGSFVGHLYEIL